MRVPTLDGEVDVRVPGGTQQGEECVLKGRGISPVFGGEKGDLYVTFNVTLPRHVNCNASVLHRACLSGLLTWDAWLFRSLTKKQRQILQRYVDEIEGKPSSEPDTVSSTLPPPVDGTSAPRPNRATDTEATGESEVPALGLYC